MSSKALVVLTNGFEEIEAVTIIDVLRRGGVEVVTASLSDSLSVNGAHGMQLSADALFATAKENTYDAVILPGGPGTDALRRSTELHARLHQQKEDGGLICAICAAPLVLSDAGLLEPHQHVTCYPTCVMELDRQASGVPVVCDNAIITGQAPGSALLFSLVVLKTLTDDKVAQKVARALVTDVL